MKYEKSCGAVLFRQEQDAPRYLLLRSSRAAKYWGFAKGHVENGETEAETCRREVFEETGIRELAILPGFRETTRYVVRGAIDKEVVLFLARVQNASVRIQREEIMEYRWCDLAGAVALLTYADAKQLLQKADAYLADASR